jgi:hypothetical protein
MAKSTRGKRPQLVAVSGEMRRVSSLLEQELLRWPDVKVRSMFGLRAFYRGVVIFAMLPDKRALENPQAIGYKLADGDPKRPGEKWLLFDLKNENEIDNALACLDTAYRRAAGRSRRR